MKVRNIFRLSQLPVYALGICGSIFIIIVMMRPTFRAMPRSLLCLGLASVNLLFLIYSICLGIYELFIGINPQVVSMAVCKLNIPLSAFCIHMDAILITILTMERFLAVVTPFRIKQIVTNIKVKILLTVLTLFFLAWDAEMIFRMDLVDTQTNPVSNSTMHACTIVDKYYNLPQRMLQIKDQISVLMRSFIPIAIMIPANIAIIVTLNRQKQARSDMTNCSNQNNNQTSKTTWMIVSASIGFIITVSPVSIYQMIVFRKKLDGQAGVIIAILATIFRINPVMNFFLYFFSGGLFKKEVRNLFASWHLCKKWPKIECLPMARFLINAQCQSMPVKMLSWLKDRNRPWHCTKQIPHFSKIAF